MLLKFNKFNKQAATLFLDPHSDKFEIDGDVNVILSPSLYWVKKISLPVKSVREAKPLLASLFEDTIPDGHYSYSVYKDDDKFYIFAYEDKVILDTLEAKGISAKQVKKVYFSQSEFAHIDGAMKINEKQSIYVKDGVVVLVPCCWIEEKSTLDISNTTFSKHHITLKQFGHIVDEKTIYSLIFILVFFIAMVLSEYLITLKHISQTQTKKDELFQTYHLKPTMMQNNSILKNYKKTYKTEMHLRDYIAIIVNLRLNKKEKISLLEFKNNILTVEFSGLNNKDKQEIEKILNKKGLKFNSKFKTNTWHVEIEI